jgi:hypothetical protein
MGEPSARTLVRRMALDRAEFLRLLPSALGDLHWRKEGSQLLAEDPPRRIEIRLGAEAERKLGALVLPQMDITFHFEGLTAKEIDSFLKRFDLTFQRGGG